MSSRTSHLDHIIPWDYVGDNLSDNYQMLCEICNTRKGTSTYFEISMLLLNK
ncbi:MAG: HNH endonuclease [Clostridia bacterium]|nr:HNH endonuclease [Clostridia bacterium]